MKSTSRNEAPVTGRNFTIPPVRRVLASASMGQFVEWYEFVIYAYSAAILAKLFFPSDDPVTGILSVFGVYAVGFLMRPLGGIVFGILGDRIGRRKLLVAVLLSMGAATTAIGLLPTYDQVGVLAPILLVLCRMVQGFSAAGETVGSNAFVAEHAPKNKRGLYVAFSFSFSTLPSVFAALFVLFLMNSMGPEVYENWGWRIAFLVGAPMALVGLYIRSKVDESPVFEAAQAAKAELAAAGAEAPALAPKVSSRPAIIQTVALAALSSLAFYTLSGYMVTYLTSGAQLTTDQALISNGTALFFAFVSFWVGGALSDRFGRKPILFASIWGAILLYLPAFWLAGLGMMWSAVLGQLIIAIVFGVFWGVFGVTAVELFPTRNRLSGATISWNMAYTVFGGTAPLLSTWLIAKTGLLIAPGIYMMIVAIVVLIVVRNMPETAGSSMLHAQDRAIKVPVKID
jgi:MHS family proline/betaine transporter-like MFS transporter